MVSVAAVDGGVAAGETAASTPSAIAVGTGRRGNTSSSPHAMIPTTMSSASHLWWAGSDIRPTIVSADSNPIAAMPDTSAARLRRRVGKQLSMPPTLGP